VVALCRAGRDDQLDHMRKSRGVVEVLVVASALGAMLVSPPAQDVAAAAGDTPIRVLEETPLSPAADVPSDVRTKCDDLGEELPKAIARGNRRVMLVDNGQQLADRSGKYLSIEITQVKAHGAGALTGPKNMTVRGSLIENGREIANFDAKRKTMGAAGTCSTLEKAEKELGADIALWLENPRPRAHLGDQ
jgi:hypothetical protein